CSTGWHTSWPLSLPPWSSPPRASNHIDTAGPSFTKSETVRAIRSRAFTLEADVAAEIHRVPPLRQAAEGLGMVFAAAALCFLILFIRWLLLPAVLDPRWDMATLGIWAFLDLMGFRGRWLCLRAKASLRAKNVLRSSLVLSGLGLLLEFGLAVFTSL